ncbi:DUF805 domain-containing protein [Halomonas sp. OfavH-34-E]|uniref:DUF805 domain-containing protein n=1 Tax=Halomonas sp. OfavH-34-E TaxID=2954491 RepID=UPI0020978D9D|nr:DUF805 domain-containing protein [Halomonas sp. OfavH-34-E]MCO7217495.1 DUF805 domain-containing protein [Halomonas sp. OfavH-34-E]
MTNESTTLDNSNEINFPSDTEISNTQGDANDRQVANKNPGLWSTNGRIGRVRYFNRLTLPVLFVYAVYGILIYYSLTATPAAAETAASAFTISQFVLGIPLTIFALIQGKRRLNDLKKSGWLMLLFFIPLINLIPFIMVTFIKGSDGDNRFGAEPSPLTSNEMTLFWFLTGLSVVACVALASLTL